MNNEDVPTLQVSPSIYICSSIILFLNPILTTVFIHSSEPLELIIAMDDEPQLYKIVLIGNSGTGKTNITTQYIKGEFYEDLQATVGVEFYSKTLTLHQKEVKITLWDTAGQERYRSLSKVYYKGARGVLAVYDITDPQSYIDIQNWLRLANEAVDLSEITVFIVGNKTDLTNERQVTAKRALKEFKEEFDIDCWEVSAKTGHNVKEMFASMFEKIYLKGEVKGSVLYAESEIGTYSEVDRDSSPVGKPIELEAIPLTEIVGGQQQVNPGKQMPMMSYMTARMTLTNTQHVQRMEQSKKKRRCCH